MRTSVWAAVLATRIASADDTPPTDAPHDDPAHDGITLRMRRLSDLPPEGWLHVDGLSPTPAFAAGGLVDGRAIALDLGPRARLAAEGTWWQTGLAPSAFATDLRDHGWRASAELSYDLGPFRIGVNASLEQSSEGSHRMVGLFAYRTFRLSYWMHAWIMLGVALEEWRLPGAPTPQSGATAGLWMGTTFR